jgi:hypothetical protein
MNRNLANNSVLNQSNNNTYTDFADKSTGLNRETNDLFYDMRAKSVIKKRADILKKKEDFNRQRLNEKLARIELLQKKKQEQKSLILDRRLTKSPAYLITQYSTS